MKKIMWGLIAICLILCSCGSDKRKEESNRGSKEIIVGLQGLSFNDFVEISYRELISRSPELVTEMGLDDTWGLPGNMLNNMSEEYLEETENLQRGILSMLDGYSGTQLIADQLESRAVMEWYLKDVIAGGEYRLNSFQVNHFIIGEPGATELFFSDIQPVRNISEAENYIERLEQVGTKFTQLANGLLLREEAGVILPETSISWTLQNLLKTSVSEPEKTVYYQSLKIKLEKLEIDDESTKKLLELAISACESSVIPGYRILEERLKAQRKIAQGNNGSWSLPKGEDYYKYSLSHHTTADYSPEQIHQMGKNELDRIHAEMKMLFTSLGIDSQQSIEKMYRTLDGRAEIISADKMTETYASIITEAEEYLPELFNTVPEAEVIVKAADSGGYYLPAALDGSRPGMFFATKSSGPFYRMPTLTFHETIPGHHLQLGLANELPVSMFQKGSSFLGYIEGWALYAEELMAESGYYDNNPEGRLGMLQAEAHRAARMVMDTGLHYYKWDLNKAVDFFIDNTGYSRGYGQWEVMRYLIWPGQATAYMTGKLKILELREIYRSTRGDDFNIRDFHTLILEEGASPLNLLDKKVRAAI
ncbi:MAG: DUF885 domain-containing protein [Spirochaetales bacterium]|nr:DUF885 domain-containing protein [Spirochaetales bacterium]